MSEEKSLSKAIKHYQNSLEKYSENRNDFKLLHYISRLQELPVQVHHLEETGVGRTVNGLRKLGGEVSEAAKSLVGRWKQMVLAQHEQEEEEAEENRNNNNNNNDNDDDDDDVDDTETENMIIDTNEEEHLNHSNYHSDSDVKQRRKCDQVDDGDEDHHDNDDDDGGGEEVEERNKDHEHKRSKHESHDKLEKSHKSRKHKHKDKDNHRDTTDTTKSHHNHHKEHTDRSSSSSKSKSEKYSNHKHDKEKEKSESKEKKRHKSSKSDNNSSSSSSKREVDKSTKKDHHHHHHKSNEKRPNDSKHKSKKDVMVKATNGIDSASGASFAEALGMCEPSSSKITTKRKLTPDKNGNGNGNGSSSSTVVKEKTMKLTEIPKPIEETPPDIDITSLLPPITPNYRPLGNLAICDIATKKTIDYDDLSTIITSKNQRTKVYSGNKTVYTTVPSLFDLCVRVLQDNIDALEYTGGVPYLILKPILEKATPNQLFALEHHNPYLVEDTDELWQFHSLKNFRNKQPDEFESWREMYMRCLDEREAKLKALTANIKQAQDKSTPIRTTKLAYVDDVAKPPRNILKKQVKNAILDRPTITPSARLNSIATAGEAGKISVPNPGSRAAERSSNHHATSAKPKKAPLMMKSISQMKNRFRR